jgi:SAM-dependent methyltransferase
MNVVDLREFYAGAFGQTTALLLSAAIQPMLSQAPDQKLIGLGYTVPFLDAMRPADATRLAFMPARQGVIHWPKLVTERDQAQRDSAQRDSTHRDLAQRAALVDEYDLPLLESSIDHVLCVHGLEAAENPLDMLQEIWRVMAPQGRLVLVVPNRRGLWATTDSSPFGQGQPFSRRQISGLLKDAQFSVVALRHALFMPPTGGRLFGKLAPAVERVGAYSVSRFSGVIIVQAMKQVYAFSSGKRARRFVPQMRPAMLPAPGAAGRRQV